MNKSIIKELVRESIRTSVGSKQVNESVMLTALAATGGIALSALIGRQMLRSKAKKVYDNHWHVVDKKFHKFVLKQIGVSDKDATTLMLAQFLSVDATALEMETDDNIGTFDDVVRYQMLVDETTPIIRRLKTNASEYEVFAEDFTPPSNIGKSFKDVYAFQHAALGFILKLIEDVERLTKTTPRPVSPSFDKDQVAMYRKLKQAYKARYF